MMIDDDNDKNDPKDEIEWNVFHPFYLQDGAFQIHLWSEYCRGGDSKITQKHIMDNYPFNTRE